jgi:hypothetical protein
MLNTGRRLSELDVDDMFAVSLAFLYRRTRMVEGEMEAREKLEQIFSDLAWEYETGLPAIARSGVFAAADGSTDSPFG